MTPKSSAFYSAKITTHSLFCRVRSFLHCPPCSKTAPGLFLSNSVFKMTWQARKKSLVVSRRLLFWPLVRNTIFTKNCGNKFVTHLTCRGSLTSCFAMIPLWKETRRPLVQKTARYMQLNNKFSSFSFWSVSHKTEKPYMVLEDYVARLLWSTELLKKTQLLEDPNMGCSDPNVRWSAHQEGNQLKFGNFVT